MGKRRIAIEKIEKRESRNVTFCKRRQGLFKKASTLCTLCNANIGIIVFSPSAKNNVYTFGNPSVDKLIDRFYNNQNNNSLVAVEEESSENERGLLWWDNIDFSNFDSMEKLKRLETDLMDVKQKVQNQLEKLINGSSSSPPPSQEEEEESECWLWPSNEDTDTLLNNFDFSEQVASDMKRLADVEKIKSLSSIVTTSLRL
uniref:MADS-box protein AGL63 n=1 Tax=Aquilegia coerulea TaxID=218851 RepID=K7XJ77_AQUCA|nr:MADS-box protein AGL63 [Aquilegia coerulea]